MTSPEVIFTICRRTTASPYYILKSLILHTERPAWWLFWFTVVTALLSREIIFAWLNLFSNQVSTTCVQILKKTGWNNLCAICAKFKQKNSLMRLLN